MLRVECEPSVITVKLFGRPTWRRKDANRPDLFGQHDLPRIRVNIRTELGAIGARFGKRLPVARHGRSCAEDRLRQRAK